MAQSLSSIGKNINAYFAWNIIIEPAHGKTYNKRLVRPAKTQIRLRIRAVWSESSLIACAFYSLQAIQKWISKNHCLTGWMYWLIWVFAGYTGLVVGLVVCLLNCLYIWASIWEKSTSWRVHSNQPAHSHSLVWVFVVHVRMQNFASLASRNVPSEDSDQTANALGALVRRYVFWRWGSYMYYMSQRQKKTYYNELSLQRHHFFPKMVPLKWICCCKESFTSRMICMKILILSLFPHTL